MQQPPVTIPMIPGPTSVHPEVFKAMSQDYGSADEDEAFLDLYNKTTDMLGTVMGTKNQVVLMTGEGMLALWSALKSCLTPGDTVLSIGTGYFGEGIGYMAKTLGCRVETLAFPYNTTIGCGDTLQRIEEAICRLRPMMITAVHCETPSGTLNPLVELGRLKEEQGVPLFYVDAVASCGGAPVEADACHVDLLLVGSQKCFSVPPSMSAVGISERAWELMRKVQYQGYDSLLAFKDCPQTGYFPYTPYWHGIAAMHAGMQVLLNEGLENVYRRHECVAHQCREGLRQLGITLFPASDAVASPTVTAALIPEGHSWQKWKNLLRQEGLTVAPSFGEAAGAVFRLGHMGTQADEKLMTQALSVLQKVLS